MAPRTTTHWDEYCIRNGRLDAPLVFDLDESTLGRVSEFLDQLMLWRAGFEETDPQWNLSPMAPYPVHVSLRMDGRLLGEGIACGESLETSLRQAVDRALRIRSSVEQMPNERGDRLGQNIQTVSWLDSYADDLNVSSHDARGSLPKNFRHRFGTELTLFFGVQDIADRSTENLNRQFDRGRHGLGMQFDGLVSYFSNSKAIIHNYSVTKLCERLAESLGQRPSAYRDTNQRLVRYQAVHLVRQPGAPGGQVRCLERCDRVIKESEVNATTLESGLDSMESWLRRSVRPDGRMEYKYMPSRGSYSSSNNMIRQWMSTHALAALYRRSNDNATLQCYRRNLDYNLTTFRKEKDDYAYIEYNGKAKLGAAACALMSIIDGPTRMNFFKEAERLKNVLLHLSEDDGSFRTFLIPADRNDNQSFYSGEALLALAMWLKHQWSDEVAERVKQGMRFYLSYYRTTRRYAPFIPWHTMAYFRMHELTGDDDYVSPIFELNDWLLCLQNVTQDGPMDTLGRFYRVQHSFHGPPHSSSTAIYVEGLTYALKIARDRGDRERARAYLEAIRLGLRSLMQLQFRNENSFYLSKKDRVLGGIRTTVADNQLRCDNTQHSAMAVLACLENMSTEDFDVDLPDASEFRSSVETLYAQSTPLSKQSVDCKTANLVLAGDIQLGRFTEVWSERYGAEHAFGRIQSLLDHSDAFIGNLECVVATKGNEVKKAGSKVWHLRASPSALDMLKPIPSAVMSVANNHSMDFGPDALVEMTKHHLPQHGVQFAGAGSNLHHAMKPVLLTIQSVTIAFHSITTIEPEFQAAEDSPGYNWADAHDVASFRNRLGQMIDLEGADQLSLQRILAIHWGRNHDPTVTESQRALAHAAVDMGFNLIVGHHAHINRGIEVYRSVPIFYDLGNFLVDFKFQSVDDQSIMPLVQMASSGAQAVELVPVTLRDKCVSVAIGQQAARILDRIERLSSPFKTRITQLKGRGFVHL